MSMSLNSLTDEQLVELYKAEKDVERAKYLEVLFERYQKRVFYWCYKLLGNYDEAIDLAQDIFLTVCQKIETFAGRSRFSTWLYEITRNHCLNWLERAETKLRAASVSMDASQEQSGEEKPLLELEDPDWRRVYESIERQEMIDKLNEIMQNHLTEQERKIMYLRYYENMPMDEITHLLGLTNITGSRAFIQKAERTIKREMAKFLQGRRARLSEKRPPTAVPKEFD
jgi:RNA polymerase sigma-70 factor (ECF subfamily)